MKTNCWVRSSILLTIVLLVLVACTDRKSASTSILSDSSCLRTGDVVFRRGSGLASHAVLIAGRGGVYSHVGIVVDSAGVPMIVHAVPGEPDYEGDEDRVKMERPQVFFSQVHAVRGEVRRHQDTLLARRAADVAMQVYRRHTLFDHDYDDADTTRMYCTELVAYAFRRAGRPLSGIRHHGLTFLDVSTDCVLPSDILACKDLYQIIQF